MTVIYGLRRSDLSFAQKEEKGILDGGAWMDEERTKSGPLKE